MSGLFGGKPQGPTRIQNVQINQSNQGYPVPVVMGKGKVQQTILWVDGFRFKKVDVGGGKGFGGKGGSQYVYSADVLAGLCDSGVGGIIGIGGVWSGQSWLSNTNTVESYTIAGGSPAYTPTYATNMTGDHGVGYVVPLSASYDDLGAPASTVLATDLLVSFQAVPFGSTLTDGQYSIDPATNTYHFSTANVGYTVQLSYTFALGVIKKQENVLIPSGVSVYVGGSIPFAADGGVIYRTGSGDPLDGTPLTRTTGTPSTGQYRVTGSGPATYGFASGDINKEVQITYKLDNSSALPAGTQTSLAFSVLEGGPGEAPWALLQTNFPGAALSYPGVAKIAYAPMDLGSGGQIQQNVFEVMTADAWGGGNPDCNAVQCILQVLSNPRWGLGSGSVPFPLSAIDNTNGGTWGSGNAGHAGNGAQVQYVRGPLGSLTEPSATAWFAANNFFISPVIDRQETAASLIGRWLEAGACAAFMSEGLLKLVPYGDTSAAANGFTWTAPTAFAAELDDTAFLAGPGEDPVKISSTPWTEAFNTVQISWSNRANQYAAEITPASDKATKNRYGDRIEDPVQYDFITTLDAARFAGSMRLNRNIHRPNTYQFKLPFRYGFLEPMAIVSITTSNAWAPSENNTIQLVRQPARITKWTDNGDGTFDVVCEDCPFGAHQPTAFGKALSAGAPAPNQFADPGDTLPVVFEATNRLTGFRGNQIWIGAAGSTDDWGGCNVYASMDGDKYVQISTVDSWARIGTLGASLPSGADPDTTHTLVVNLFPNVGPLESGTTGDADQGNTLCYVDGEIIAYSACVITGQDQYTADTYLRRGRMGSAVAAHASGAAFLRLDDAVLRYTYDPSWAGKTVSLKFQSFNRFGNSAQDISSLTPLSFTVPGTSKGAVDAGTGVLLGGLMIPPSALIQPLVDTGAVAPGTYSGATYAKGTPLPYYPMSNTE